MQCVSTGKGEEGGYKEGEVKMSFFKDLQLNF